MDNFVNLRTHTTYSFKDGYGHPAEFVSRAKELEQQAVAITDYHNISGHYKWYKECKSAGINPILGVTMLVSDDLTHIRDRGYDEVVLLPTNETGYHNLTKILTEAWMCVKPDYKIDRPVTTIDFLLTNSEGLVFLMGSKSSIGKKIIRGDVQGAEEDVDIYSLLDWYIEINPSQDNEHKYQHEQLIKFATANSIRLVGSNEAHYPKKGQHEIHDILLCIEQKTELNNQERRRIERNDMFIKSREEMENSMPYDKEIVKQALDNTVEIANRINFEFPKASAIRFKIPDDKKIPLFKKKCYDGLKTKLPDSGDEYKERLEYEIDIIIQKDFVDYFLVIEDIVMWAKDRDILVGPARGSAAGSLVSYCLSITEVDPIKYGLIFERFIDINREDMPDIDIDFQDDRRIEVKKYIEDKYGKDKVGSLPVFLTWHGKMALDDIRKVFDIPFSVIDKLKPLIIERSGGDSRASFTIMDTFNNPNFKYPQYAIKEYPQLKYSADLEGYIRQMGRHAAGVVVSNEPVSNFSALYNISDQQSVSLEYKDASSIGLLKLDLLGLSTLTIIQKTLKLIQERTGRTIDLYTLPIDDPAVYKFFIEGKLFGVFQFTGQAVNQVCRQIKPTDFESLSAISALARPGPLNSGSTTIYIKRRNGLEEVSYPHPVMKPYTEETYGIVVYQEQVMKTMREVGKMTWKETAEIRKLISRSQGVEKFNTFKDRFAVGARENGMNDHEIDVMWDSICTFGAWAFNKSHSVSYTIISYWTMWLKVYYPMEFYSSLLEITKDDGNRKKILKEYKREGYKLLSVDVNKSKQSFSIEGDSIRIGFKDLHGIGESISDELVKNQPYTSVNDLKTRVKRLGNATQVLCDVGALDSIENKGPSNLFGDGDPVIQKRELTFSERYKLCPWDVDFGIIENWMPFINSDERLGRLEITQIDDLSNENMAHQEVNIIGVVSEINLKNKAEEAQSRGLQFTPKEGVNYDFCNLIIEDDNDFITVRISMDIFPHYRDLLFGENKNDALLIQGVMGSGIRMFFANKIMSLNQYKDSDKDTRDKLLSDANRIKDKIKEKRFSKKKSTYSHSAPSV